MRTRGAVHEHIGALRVVRRGLDNAMTVVTISFSRTVRPTTAVLPPKWSFQN
jgi:hypothetical protein